MLEKSFLPAAIFALTSALAPAPAQSDDLVFFQAGLNGSAEARLVGRPAAPARAENLKWTVYPGDAGSALELGPAASLCYEMDGGFPGDAGSLELRLRPERLPAAPCAILSLAAPETAGGWSLALEYAPNGDRWLFRVSGRGWQSDPSAWHGQVKTGRWNHLLLTWNRADEPSFSLFLNGKWLTSQPFNGKMPGAAVLEIKGAQDLAAGLDSLTVYRRALSKTQAQLLAQLSTQAVDRVDGLRAEIARDDQAAAERRALVARLQGKVGRIYHTRGRAAGPVALPEGVMAEGIRPEEIGQTDLSRFAVLYFPQGPNFQITPEQYPAIREFVRNGGGYVGDCQGAYFAEKLELLPITCYYNNIWGLYKIHVKPHFVTDNRQAEITMHFGNGPIMAVGEGCRVIGTYAMKLPGDVTPAAIVVGQYGRGTVVIFGTHPTGEKVAFQGARAHFSGKLLGTERMLVNALLLAAGLVDEDGSPRP